MQKNKNKLIFFIKIISYLKIFFSSKKIYFMNNNLLMFYIELSLKIIMFSEINLYLYNNR